MNLLQGGYRDILPKDSLLTDILSNAQFDERTCSRKDILPKGQRAELKNREMFGTVTHVSTIVQNNCYMHGH